MSSMRAGIVVPICPACRWVHELSYDGYRVLRLDDYSFRLFYRCDVTRRDVETIIEFEESPR